MKGVKVINESSYPDAEVRRLVRKTLREREVSDVAVTVAHRRDESGHVTGRYYGYWYPSKGQDRERIRVSLPRPGVEILPYVPYERTRERGKTFELSTWQEALVAIVAHEAEHHRQLPRNGYQSSRKVAQRGGRGKHRMVEVECDLAAYRAVVAYRRGR